MQGPHRWGVVVCADCYDCSWCCYSTGHASCCVVTQCPVSQTHRWGALAVTAARVGVSKVIRGEAVSCGRMHDTAMALDEGIGCCVVDTVPLVQHNRQLHGPNVTQHDWHQGWLLRAHVYSNNSHAHA
jgi:hypothetical protein